MSTQNPLAPNIDVEKFFAKFPNEEYWKMFIDTQYWERGKNYFDNDSSPGYLQSVSRAFYYALATINQPVSVDLILGFHSIAYHNQKERSLGKIVEQGRFRIGEKDITKEGLTELIDHIRTKNAPIQFMELFRPAHVDFTPDGNLKPEAYEKYPFMDPDDGHFKLDNNKSSSELADLILQHMLKIHSRMMMISRVSSTSTAMSDIQNYIDTYHGETASVENDNEKKLAAIVRLIHFMHVYHPFSDGNGRTFIFILLNKLLMMNGFSPTIVRDPAAFSCWSVNELVKEVLDGQKLFERLCNPFELTKDMPLAHHLQQIAKLNEDNFLINQAKVDLLGFFEKYDSNPAIKKFIDSNHDILLRLMRERYSEQTMQTVMYKIKPNIEQMQQLISLAMKGENQPLISFLIQYTQTQHPDIFQQLMNEESIKRYFFNYNSQDGIKILQQLPIQNVQYFELLTNTTGIFAHNSSEQTFYNGLTAPDYGRNQKGYIDYMLHQITTTQFMKLMNTDYNGISGAQLLTLFMDNDKIMKHVQRIDESKRWELISLLKSKITSDNDNIIRQVSLCSNRIDNIANQIKQLSGAQLGNSNTVVARKAESNDDLKHSR